MQIQIDGTSLNETVVSVLEQMAFIFCEPADLQEGIDLDEFEFIKVSLTFDGHKSGQVTIIAPNEFCRELVANMLGEDIDNEDDCGKQADAVKEILNIITGQYLTQVYGDKVVFNLSAPEAAEIQSEELYAFIGENECACCQSDEYPVLTFASLTGEISHEYTSTDC
ncbi:MAG: chemotaxis protein CheX [FCB group bacterium]|nr:chemotaxis protein CheX [FCB group bacterium]